MNSSLENFVLITSKIRQIFNVSFSTNFTCKKQVIFEKKTPFFERSIFLKPE
nr:MAG TPA: hypothetical protein [Caudoviricetes sp.]